MNESYEQVAQSTCQYSVAIMFLLRSGLMGTSL